MPHEVMISKGNGTPDLDRLLSVGRQRATLEIGHDETRWNIGDPKDRDSLTPHQRLSELASILAIGIHRLRAIPPALPEYRQIPVESSPSGLEGVQATCPDGVRCQPETTPEE